MQINNRVIRKQLRQLLRGFGMDGDVAVARDHHCRSLVTIDRNDRGVDLVYHPRFLGLMGTISDLQLSLKHELCHLHTSPTSRIPVPSSLEGFTLVAFLEYADLFREYLAEREYARRFGVDRAYLSLRRKTFQPGRILSDVRAGLKKHGGSTDTVFLAYADLFRTFHEAICFHVLGDVTFQEWCAVRNRRSLYRYFLYVMDDMNRIAQKGVAYMEKLDLASDSFKCAVNVNLQALLDNETLSVVMPVDEIPGLKRDIAAQWKTRQIPLSCCEPAQATTGSERLGSLPRVTPLTSAGREDGR